VIITQAPAGSTIAADGKSVDVPGEGSWSVDPDTGAITFAPEAGFTGDPTPISYTVDNLDGETSNEATVTIDYPQTAPVASNDLKAGPLNTAVSVDVVANDNDPENDLDPTTVIITQSPAAGSIIAADGKSVDVPGEGSWSVAPDTGVITFTPTTGFADDPTPISYTVDDSTGLTSNEATVTIDYPPTAPIAVDDTYTVDEDGTVVLDPLNADSDFDGDVLTITDINGTTLTPGTAQSIIVPNGVVNIDAAGEISFTPDADFNGEVKFDYTITDGTETATATETITVTPVNDIEANLETEVTPEDVTLTGNVISNDTDEDGDTLTVQLATVDIDGSGTQVTLVLGTETALTDNNGDPIGDLTLNADGSYTFDPAPNFNGTVPQVSYTVTDPEGNTDSTTLDITVEPVEDVPVANPEVEITPEDTVLIDNVLTNDTDGDGNNTLTVQSV
ncbi:Ig-like domain-containing protein, partial [Psychrobacter sp. AOP7-B1-24]|uniref:Ig-like domain-containing protein n=1 Tax=Psychrobacter sp. AOP7-B1-24 TaxID=3457645 RepID=UPI00402BA0A5